jgi:hypothetical protein
LVNERGYPENLDVSESGGYAACRILLDPLIIYVIGTDVLFGLGG